MADGMLDQVLGWLKGTPPSPSLGLETAPQLPSYPTQHDADYARNYGFGDNNLHEDYLNNNKARVLGTTIPMRAASKREVFLPASGAGSTGSELLNPTNSTVLDLNKTNDADLKGQLNNTMMRAALAVNRSPIAAAGFDPSKVVVDSLIKNPSIAGLYQPKVDAIYTALNPDDAIVHESAHRGIQKLREQFPEQTGSLLKQLPDEEMVVRWLMKSKGGDPEGFVGDLDAKQRKESIGYFDPEKYPNMAKRNLDNLSQLEELAIEHMKGRGKRVGPQ